MQRRLQILALSVLVILALTGCSFDRTYLPALEADPMASYEAAGLELVRDDRNPEDDGDLIFGKPSHARVRRVYDIVDGAEGERVLSEAVSYAESIGWHMESITGYPHVFRGWRLLPPGEAGVSIGLDEENASLSVRLYFTDYASE